MQANKLKLESTADVYYLHNYKTVLLNSSLNADTEISTTSTSSDGGGGGNDMETRVRILENNVNHINEDLKDIKSDIRDLRTSISSGNDRISDKLDTLTRNFTKDISDISGTLSKRIDHLTMWAFGSLLSIIIAACVITYSLNGSFLEINKEIHTVKSDVKVLTFKTEEMEKNMDKIKVNLDGMSTKLDTLIANTK